MIDRWLASRLGDVVQSKGGQDLRVNCPFCGARIGDEDEGHHLYVNTVRPVCHCFRCDWSGNHVGLVMSVEGCTYGQALSYLHEPPPDIRKFDSLYSPMGLVNGNHYMDEPDGFQPLYDTPLSADFPVEYRAVWNYLNGRHVPKKLLVTVFGYVLGTHRAWVLVDEHWWQGRSIISGEPKYISPPWPKADSLWNANALYKGADVIAICEGVFSAIAIGDSAVALCGSSATDDQAMRLAKADVPHYVIILDAGAEFNAHELADKLMYFGYKGKLEIQYMKEGDPAEGLFGSKVAWSWEEKVLARL